MQLELWSCVSLNNNLGGKKGTRAYSREFIQRWQIIKITATANELRKYLC